MLIKSVNAVITDAKKAREYIKQFCTNYKRASGNQMDYVNTATRRIEFATMNDEDAIFVANELQIIGSEVAKQRLNKQITDRE